MNIKRLLFLGLLFSIVSVLAQTEFRKAYIVKSNNDTLYGEIEYRSDNKMAEVCRFRLSENATETNYSPSDLLEYRFIDSKYYVSKDLNGKKVFLEFLLKGQINLYYLNDDIGEHYYLEKDGIVLTETPLKKELNTKMTLLIFTLAKSTLEN